MTTTKQTFNIRQTAEALVPDQFGRTSYVTALLLILVMIGVITILLGSLPGVIPLYFTLPWGEARLAPKAMLYSLPSLSLLFLAINLMTARALNHLSPLLPKVFSVATVVVAGMMMIALLGIIQSVVL